MNKSTQRPSLDEFKNICRKEFEFLIRDFRFEEQKSSVHDRQNQFIIEFVRSDLRVTIEGVHYGSAANMYLENSSGRRILAEYLDPQFQPFVEKRNKIVEGGQMEDIRRQANLLYKHGLELLKGDNYVFESAVKRVDAAVKEYKSRSRRE